MGREPARGQGTLTVTHHREHLSRRETESSSIMVLPVAVMARAELSKAGSQQFVGLPRGYRGLRTWAILPCFVRYVKRELDLK